MQKSTIQALEIQVQRTRENFQKQQGSMTDKEIAQTNSFLRSLTETIQQAKQGLI